MKTVLPRPLFVLTTTISLVLLMGISVASAGTTLHVGSGQVYATIQAAIVAASDGDTVLVDPGSYNESINFVGKNITVESTDPTHPENTIIDGNGLRLRTVIFNHGETSLATLRGFKVINTSKDKNAADIYIASSSPTISQCLLLTATSGVYGYSGSPTISSCTFDGNRYGIYSNSGDFFSSTAHSRRSSFAEYGKTMSAGLSSAMPR